MVIRSHLDLAWKKFNLMTSSSGLILLLPVYQVYKLQMPLQRKLAVIGIFGLGALVTITGIVRLRFFALADVPFGLSHEVTRIFVPRAMTSSTSTKLVGRQFLRSRRLVNYRGQRWHPECMSADATPIVRRLPNRLTCV